MSTPNRPTESYALARITMQERLARLPERQRIAAILNAAGYTQDGISAVLGCKTRQAGSHLFNQALKGVSE